MYCNNDYRPFISWALTKHRLIRRPYNSEFLLTRTSLNPSRIMMKRMSVFRLFSLLHITWQFSVDIFYVYKYAIIILREEMHGIYHSSMNFTPPFYFVNNNIIHYFFSGNGTHKWYVDVPNFQCVICGEICGIFIVSLIHQISFNRSLVFWKEIN